MDALSFLKGLPAILGLAGFFAYLWAGQSKVGADLTKSVIDKLRQSPTVTIADFDTLTPAKIGKLIETDARVRAAVNEQDQKLIRLIVILQNGVTVAVMVVCALLVGFGFWLVSRPQPLAVIAQAPLPLTEAAGTALVDLDPLKIEWVATGLPESVSVYLENVDSQRRSRKKSVSSDVRSVAFEASELREVATSRDYRHSNRIRSVIEWSSNVARSDVVDLHVGIQVQLMLGGRLVTPGGSQDVKILMATIDDSTLTMPKGYCFQVSLVGWNQEGPFVGVLKSCNEATNVVVPGLAGIDWNRKVSLVYEGPDDRRTVRTCISGRPPPALASCN